MTLMTRPEWRIASSASPVSSTRSSTRSLTPAFSPGLTRRGLTTRIFGAVPWASWSHSVGIAINSPSESRPVMSATSTDGTCPGLLSFLPRRSTSPSRPNPRSKAFIAGFPVLRPKARAMSRLPTSPEREAMKARTSSREGRAGDCLRGGLTKKRAGAGLFPSHNVWRWSLPRHTPGVVRRNQAPPALAFRGAALAGVFLGADLALVGAWRVGAGAGV